MNKIRENINTPFYWKRFSTEAYLAADSKRGKCKFNTIIDNIPQHTSVLDVGCLGGNFRSYLLEKKVKVDFTGIDYCPESIEIAKERYPNDKWFVEDCYKTTFESDTFDIVVAMELLEHLDEPLKFLEEAKRITKEHGTILISVPNERRIDDPAHVWSFTRSDVFDMLSKISTNVRVWYVCSNDRNIVGKAILNYQSYQ